MSGACCKRIEGACCHDVSDAQRAYDLRIEQLKYDLHRPGIQYYEQERIQKEIAELPNPKSHSLCPKCHKVLKKGEKHDGIYDGAMGEYVTWHCNRF